MIMALVSVSVSSTDSKMAYEGNIRNFDPVRLDYFLPYGEDSAPAPMEYLLLSAGSCTCSGVAILLRKMGRTVRSIRAQLTGTRSDIHPTVFTSIKMELEIQSPDSTDQDVGSCIARAKTTLSPVLVMLSKVVDIDIAYVLNRSDI
jgi:putative redox protein